MSRYFCPSHTRESPRNARTPAIARRLRHRHPSGLSLPRLPKKALFHLLSASSSSSSSSNGSRPLPRPLPLPRSASDAPLKCLTRAASTAARHAASRCMFKSSSASRRAKDARRAANVSSSIADVAAAEETAPIATHAAYPRARARPSATSSRVKSPNAEAARTIDEARRASEALVASVEFAFWAGNKGDASGKNTPRAATTGKRLSRLSKEKESFSPKPGGLHHLSSVAS
mmetsp:Transcript_9136/g.38430  ORF Transcript_9136/g.38430 Transcript_9136/m.38430 type:complete len:231 (-) Transcript_9136:1221-1913(-)